MYFLEHDVMEMRQATGGAALYFRNRIREAFVHRAEVCPVEVTLDGRSELGTEIVVTPFRDDPAIGRYPALALKSYHFVLSDAVPGSLYRLSTLVPAADATTARLAESMTFVGERQ